MPPRWKTCTRRGGSQPPAKALGQEGSSTVTFTADTKAKTQLMTEQMKTAMQHEIRKPRLDEPRYEAGSAGQTARFIPQQDRLPRPLARLHEARVQAGRRSMGNVRAHYQFEDACSRGEHRLANRSTLTECGHDAADGQRLLQSADERHQLSCRRPAASAVPIRAGRRADDYTATPAATIVHELHTPSTAERAAAFDSQATPRLGGSAADAKELRESDQTASAINTRVTSLSDDIHINSRADQRRGCGRPGPEPCSPTSDGRSQTRVQKLPNAPDGFTPDSASCASAQVGPARTSVRKTSVSRRHRPHSPARARINGVVSRTCPKFQHAFS